jgi:hypothetical protein
VVTTDATFEKSFSITERFKLDLHREVLQPAESRDLQNVPGFTPGAGDFGVVSSARPARTAQLAARLSF